MPHFDQLMPSSTMKKGHLPEPDRATGRAKGVRVIIDRVGIGVPLGFQNEKINVLYLKPHPHFYPGETLPVRLSGQMVKQVAEITGESDYLRWGGREIVIFHDVSVMSGSQRVGGIRARAPQGQVAGRPVVTQQPPPVSVQPPPSGGLQYPAALSMPEDREPGADDDNELDDMDDAYEGEEGEQDY